MDAGASLAATDKTDKTPLHWLSQHGCAEAITLALRKGADANATDGSLRTPLWYATTSPLYLPYISPISPVYRGRCGTPLHLPNPNPEPEPAPAPAPEPEPKP